MNVHDIRTLYEYNYWANRRILARCANLSDLQFTAPTRFSWGSLRGTLVHTLDTEWGWRTICQHGTFTADMTEVEFSTVAAIEQRWAEEETAMFAYLDSLSDDDMNGVVRYHTDTGILRERTLWHCLFHVVNHGMQHRSEAAAMLTDYNHSPGDLDFTLWLNERAQPST